MTKEKTSTASLTMVSRTVISKLEQAKWSLRIAEQLMFEALQIVDSESMRIAIKQIQDSQIRIETEQDNQWAF